MRYRLAVPLILAAAAATPAAQAQVKDVVQGAQAPLRDTRVDEKKIPDVLLLAQSAPYSLTNAKTCPQIRQQIDALTAVLGADADTPAQKKGDSAAIAATASRAVVGTLIPGFGLVRVVTGADKAQRRAEAAVYAGGVRRAFLKGVGLGKGCPVPAAPTLDARRAVPELPSAKDKD